MILGVLFSNLKFSEFWICIINMDKRTKDTTKMHGSTTLPLDPEILNQQPQWTRCNSFSSCSNDSSMFCNSHPSQNSIFQSDKHLLNDGQHSSHLLKRNRNSSGSSESSTVSSASDRGTKNTVIITSTSLPQVVKTELRSESLARLSCPEISPNGYNLQHDALLSCSSSPNSVLPFRHNLRRNIRKKTCSCDCTTTCTTLVVRRYKEKNLEEETVISSTKVQTCIQNNASQEIHNVSFEKSFSERAENNRKRRSEVEKLYDSLHEIKWAKNFSPDNILRQLNIRQAASCSLFGRSSPNKSSPTFTKPSKKQKLDNDQSLSPCNNQLSNAYNDQPSNSLSGQSPDLSSDQSTTPCSSKTSSLRKKFNKTIKNHGPTNRTLRSHSKNSASVLSKEIDASAVNTDNCKQLASESLKTSGEVKSEEKFIISSPMKTEHDPPINYIDSLKSTSTSHENCLEKRDNDGSLFDKAGSSVLPVNYLLNLKGNSEIHCPNIVSEYPTTFYDMAEEGIRTIDACFREVGAEVVISTCFEKDNDLPRLTAVKDNVLDKSVPTDDGPPVLEPCVSLQDRVSLQNIECKVASDFPVADKSDAALKFMYEKNLQCSPKREDIHFTQNSLQESPVKIEDQSHEQSAKVINKLHINAISRHVDNSIVKDKCRKISNKYLKLLRSKSRTMSIEKHTKPTKVESSSISPINRTVGSVVEDKQLCPDNKDVSCSSAISHFPLDSKELSFRTSGEKAQTTTILQTSNKRVSYLNCPERIAFNQSTSNSFVYSNNKESFSHVSTNTKNLSNQSVIVEESRTNVLHVQHSSLPPVIVTHAYVPIKKAIKEKETLNEEVPRTPDASFTCHYRTIKVNRQNSYTQVQLKLNRGCSIFLTVESLTEMKDVLRRTSQDTNCHILILNGIGDSFCLGLDLLPLLGPQKIKASTEIAVAVKEFIEELSSFKKPFVAVANGSAFGLGMTILNHADICIASDTAKFCLPQTSLGYFPEGGATLTLPQAVGSTMATDLILRGRTITAHEAKSIGLVSEIMEAKYLPYDLVNRVKTLAENSQTGMETAKAMLKMRLHVELLMVLENEVKLLPKMWLSRPCQEAMQNTSHTWLLSE